MGIYVAAHVLALGKKPQLSKSHNYPLDVVEISDNNEGGIKYATLEITASYAYGCLKSETGTHQRVKKHLIISSNFCH
ncbi:PCRF domain-containing protein [Nostoc sp.]|uniref:PCRF domain-containing protein n=1 Tax=Nostoc sp. TaxID=1180 RepID=UPI003FA53DB4